MASGQPDYTRQVAVTVIDTPDPITVIADVTSPPLNVTFPSTQDVNVLAMPASTPVAVSNFPSSQNVAVTSMPASTPVAVSNFPSSQNVAVASMPTSSGVQIKGQDAALTTTPSEPFILGRSKKYEDTSFVQTDSPATLPVNNDLGRHAHAGYIVNDGPGDFTYEISDDGTNWGGAHTLKMNETVKLAPIDIHSIRITRVTDSAYRVMVV